MVRKNERIKMNEIKGDRIKFAFSSSRTLLVDEEEGTVLLQLALVLLLN